MRNLLAGILIGSAIGIASAGYKGAPVYVENQLSGVDDGEGGVMKFPMTDSEGSELLREILLELKKLNTQAGFITGVEHEELE